MDALLNGASVHFFDVKAEGSSALASWMARQRITIFKSTPSLFRHLADALNDGIRLPHLRVVSVIGEAVHQHDLDLYRRHFPDDCLFVNSYGSTETGAICRIILDKHTVIDGPIVPVGYPIHEYKILLLGENGKEVPPGEIGSIAVQGPYVAPSDLQPDDAARRGFEQTSDGEWLYHTGDLGRLRPDGAYEHLGRRDAQVKIRGYRVEPAEIEVALLAHPRIRSAAVVAVDTPAYQTAEADKRLVAYLVGETIPSVAELRQFLGEKLPDYLIPSAFIPVDVLPLTVGGKLDLRALPPPDAAPRLPRTAPRVPTRTPYETWLVALWADVLGHEDIGIEDHFFDLGGTSLLAGQVVAAMERTFGLTIPLEVLEQRGTIALLAPLLESGRAVSAESPLISVRSGGTERPLFFVSGLGGLALPFFTLARYLSSRQRIYAFQLPYPDDKTIPYVGVKAIAELHLDELRKVQPEGPYSLAGYSFGGIVAYEMAQQLVGAGEQVAHLILLDAGFPGIPTPIRQQYQKSYGYFTALTLYHVLRSLRAPQRWVSVRESLGLWKKRTVDQFGLRMNRKNRAQRILRGYSVQPYTGRLLYVAATKHRPHPWVDHWRRLTLGDFTAVEIACDHGDLLQAPYVRSVAHFVEEYLNKAVEAEVDHGNRDSVRLTQPAPRR
jgi:thioesterase domain-containing protein